MPKTLSGGLDTARAAGTTQLALFVKATRVQSDGEVFAFTSWPLPLTVDGQRYEPGFNRTSIVTTSNLSVDNLEILGAMESQGITEADVRAGKWDGCEVLYFEANAADLSQGVMYRKRGWIGEIKSGRLAFIAELHGLLRKLQQEIGRIFTPGCPWQLGHAGTCGVRLDPPLWTASTAYTVRQARDARTGSVVRPTNYSGTHFQCTVAGTSGGTEPTWNVGGTTVDGSVNWQGLNALTGLLTVSAIVSDRLVFNTDLSFPDEWFSDGKLTWLTGLNLGTGAHFVKRSLLAAGRVELRKAMFFAVQVGDTASISAGCFKRIAEDCRDKFDNADNFGGYPDLTGIDQVITQGVTS